jgi:glutamate---cysteine ligase / carboxylate-amine ligase
LCKYLLDKNEAAPAEDDYLVYNYNRFQACRFGLDGVIVHPKNYEQLSLREDILSTLRHIQPYAEALGSATALENIYYILRDGNDAGYLRQQYMNQGSIEGMVDAAIAKFREG